MTHDPYNPHLVRNGYTREYDPEVSDYHTEAEMLSSLEGSLLLKNLVLTHIFAYECLECGHCYQASSSDKEHEEDCPQCGCDETERELLEIHGCQRQPLVVSEESEP
jgi:ssDNA-binding Zn-finger/Zn-ribbon topoisomerase 1